MEKELWWEPLVYSGTSVHVKPKQILYKLEEGCELPKESKYWEWFYDNVQRRQHAECSEKVFSSLPDELVNNTDFFDVLLYEARYDSMVAWLEDPRLTKEMRDYMLERLSNPIKTYYDNWKLRLYIKEKYGVKFELP